MNVIKGLLGSKKVWMSIVGVIVAIAGKQGLDLDVTEVMAVIAPIMAYIVGQGIADVGKEKEKIKDKGSSAAR